MASPSVSYYCQMLCEISCYELTASATVWADFDWRPPPAHFWPIREGLPWLVPDSILPINNRYMNLELLMLEKRMKGGNREEGAFGGLFRFKNLLSSALTLYNSEIFTRAALMHRFTSIVSYTFHAHVWTSLSLWLNFHASAINQIMQHFTTAFDFTGLVTYSSSHSNSCRCIDRSSRKNSFPGGSHSCSDRILELGNREILSHWMVFNSLEMFMS